MKSTIYEKRVKQALEAEKITEYEAEQCLAPNGKMCLLHSGGERLMNINDADSHIRTGESECLYPGRALDVKTNQLLGISKPCFFYPKQKHPRN